ncbi:MAG: Fic family protein [Bacteroidota bacterium]|nr:Fic family protein [Bacteroidota bacterium]
MAKIKLNITTLVDYIKQNPGLSSKKIHENIFGGIISYATVKRALKDLEEKNFIITVGKGKGTKYELSKAYELIHNINVGDYFKKETDERIIKNSFNHKLIKETLNKIDLFSKEELQHLNGLQEQYTKKIAKLTVNGFKKEMERLAIDLSWKSSQIEGNTYSLLETESLLKDKKTAAGKTKDEAVMLLNHKDALDFIVDNPDYISPLKLSSIEDIHSILIKELGVDRNIRIGGVGITGTNYKPLDNDFQIKEAMEELCGLVNLKENIFEKAFLVLILISYIQPFNDGNKRTARIISNAILMNNKYCPLSFRTVDAEEYKKAMLIFYEQNNISAFKHIFITQFEFAVNTYF